ncbi:MAG TPA: lipopolysaccharide biosynthesis protein [Planctomycetota bacterium]|nr:lipopolysaccharide biosynthesis protein [Planctomycetota bacterium]
MLRLIAALFSMLGQRRIVREGLWVLTGLGGAALAQLAGLRIFTEFALPRDFGEANLLLLTLMLCRSVFVGPFSNAQMRHHPDYAHAGRANWYTHEIGRLIWYSSGICALAVAIIFFVWSLSQTGQPRWGILGGMIAVIALETPKTLLINRLNAERRQARLALWTIVEALGITLCSAVLLYRWRNAEAFLAGQAAGTSLALLANQFLWRPTWAPDTTLPQPGERKNVIRRALHYGLPFAPVSIFGWISGQSDRFLLKGLTGDAEVGLYSAPFALANRPLTTTSAFLSLLLRPVLFTAESENNGRAARRIFLIWFVCALSTGAIVVLAFFLAGPWAARHFLGENYRQDAGEVMFLVALGFALVPATQAIETRLLSFGRTKSLILPQIVGTVSSLAATLYLVPRIGYLGVAKARVIGTALQFVVTASVLLVSTPKITPAPDAPIV